MTSWINQINCTDNMKNTHLVSTCPEVLITWLCHLTTVITYHHDLQVTSFFTCTVHQQVTVWSGLWFNFISIISAVVKLTTGVKV